jgi:hypothetical protein
MTRSRPSAPGPTGKSDARVGGVAIHHADKVWWPGDSITKGDVASF